MTKKNIENKTLNEVKDLLNQIAILTKKIETPEIAEDYNGFPAIQLNVDRARFDAEGNYNCQGEYDKNGNKIDPSGDANSILWCIGQYAQRVLKSEELAVHVENQYHISTC